MQKEQTTGTTKIQKNRMRIMTMNLMKSILLLSANTQILPFWQQKQVFEKTIEIGFIITNHGLLHLYCKRRKRIGRVHLAAQAKIILL